MYVHTYVCKECRYCHTVGTYVRTCVCMSVCVCMCENSGTTVQICLQMLSRVHMHAHTYVHACRCVACVYIHMYATQGWEDVAHLKDELLTQQRKVDKLKSELADLEKAENSLKVWAGRGQV